MSNGDLVLGIDTSNYTTSVSLTDRKGRITADKRIPLVVKQGERGLRQSTALFQHLENLPQLLEEVFKTVNASAIKAVAVSSRPRPVEGSYMPVFKAGLQFGRTLSAALSVPLYLFSHQEGHLASGIHESGMEERAFFLSWHLSGGTCELLRIKNFPKSSSIEIVGGSRDISFGQLIDRAGVAMGLTFPSGKELDRLACIAYEKQALEKQALPEALTKIKKIPAKGLHLNLSGTETQILREIAANQAEYGETLPQEVKEELAFTLFLRIAECLLHLSEKACAEGQEKDILLVGGVSASTFLKRALTEGLKLPKCPIRLRTAKESRLFFGRSELASDNAVGISLLGGSFLWH